MDIASFRRRAVPLVIAAAAALALSPPPSLAASASASLTNISLSVIDLDLADGITAAYSFVQGASQVQGSFGADNGFGSDSGEVLLRGLNSPFVSASGSASVSGAQSRGATTPNSITLAGATSAAGTSFIGGLGFFRDFPVLRNLQLTPHTQLIVGADYSVSATAFDACSDQRCEAASAQVVIAFDADSGGGGQSFRVDAEAQPGGGVSFTSNGPPTGSFQVLFDNVGDLTTNLHLEIFTNVDGVGAVPEPETYALMLLGLGALGIVSRRRNRR